jgi:hypothetical protein
MEHHREHLEGHQFGTVKLRVVRSVFPDLIGTLQEHVDIFNHI